MSDNELKFVKICSSKEMTDEVVIEYFNLLNMIKKIEILEKGVVAIALNSDRNDLVGHILRSVYKVNLFRMVRDINNDKTKTSKMLLEVIKSRGLGGGSWGGDLMNEVSEDKNMNSSGEEVVKKNCCVIM
jgi:hypothetical protein